MKILLTNDDGIDAPGLEVLWNVVRQCFSDTSAEVIVVAPDRGRSECGHSVSSGDHLVVKRVRPNWYSVSGTPVECVRAALFELAPETDYVFSGINAGANLGIDLLVSGTFAAAREAAIHCVASMAISQYRRPEVPVALDHSSKWLEPVITAFRNENRLGLKNPPIPIPVWNVNLPAIHPTENPPHVKYCQVDRYPNARV